MKLAISSTGRSLDSDVDLHFGRCPFFIVYDDETRRFTVLENSGLFAAHGSGVGAAQNVAISGAKIVLTGNIGPDAFKTLKIAGLTVYIGVSGNIRAAIDEYHKGELKRLKHPTVNSHFGLE